MCDKQEVELWPEGGLENVSCCPVCGSVERDLEHPFLRDEFHGAALGEWDLFKCKKCDSSYLDPRPTPETIGLAYASYPTHDLPSEKELNIKPRSMSEHFRRRMLFGYINSAFGYDMKPSIGKIARLLDLYPPWANRARNWVKELPHRSNQPRLLDVGCGRGTFLRRMSALGWDVTGLEPDAKAVKVVREHGFKVFEGNLETFDFEKAKFNAITLGDVIEHLHSPIANLKACYDLLQPGGILSIQTPNVGSFGHRLLGSSWHALMPPYHLVLFTPESLQKAAESLGFKIVSTRATTRPCASMSASMSMKDKKGKSDNMKRLIALMYCVFGVWTGIFMRHNPQWMEGFSCVFQKPVE